MPAQMFRIPSSPTISEYFEWVSGGSMECYRGMNLRSEGRSFIGMGMVKKGRAKRWSILGYPFS